MLEGISDLIKRVPLTDGQTKTAYRRIRTNWKIITISIMGTNCSQVCSESVFEKHHCSFCIILIEKTWKWKVGR